MGKYIIVGYDLLFGDDPVTNEASFQEVFEPAKKELTDNINVYTIAGEPINLVLFSRPLSPKKNGVEREIIKHVESFLRQDDEALVFIHTGSDTKFVFPEEVFYDLPSSQKTVPFAGGGQDGPYGLIDSSGKFVPEDINKLKEIVNGLWSNYYLDEFTKNFLDLL